MVRLKFFVFIFSIAMGSILLTLFAKGIPSALVISIVIGAILFITKRIWLPDGWGRYAVRWMSLGISLSAALSFGFFPSLIENIVKAALNTIVPKFIEIYPVEVASPSLVFAFLALVIWIVNYFNRDKTAMKVHYDPIDKDIPDRTFKQKLKGVCGSLSDDLRSVDIQLNWSAQYFTPLDAEVEVKSGIKKKKKIMDLLSAIKKSNDRLFLVLGDPGSGKSVALRKLAQDLTPEAIKTGKVPVYINLKEWAVEQKWDENNPPTVQHLHDFVYENLNNRDIVTSKFFEKYFDRLYERGRLYFILDSFDEIPAVLDERENSDLIRQLSQVIFRFLKGARDESSQGILASRIFRKPTREFQAGTILEIRPFTEAKIIETLKRSGHFSEDLVHKLFKKRAKLVTVARNPFSATLISEYAENNCNQLPANQTEMYASYIERNLNSCTDRIVKRGLTIEGIIGCCFEIADKMFQKYGMEAPVNQLRNDLPNYPMDDVINILQFARLGRVGTSCDNRFSFIHRRFTEYFAVQKIIKEDRKIDMESILTNSQWRDAMVLYCEVVEESRATSIAEFCWDVINSTGNPQHRRVIHCMNFLRDAFKGRLECIQSFRDNLAEYIYNQIDGDNNMLSVKLAVETVGLLGENDIDRCIVKAMNFNNSWINETAFKACRHLPSASKVLERKLVEFLDSIPVVPFFKRMRGFKFSLSLSGGLVRVMDFVDLRFFDHVLAFTAILLVFIAVLKLLVVMKLFVVIGYFLIAPFFLFLLYVLELNYPKYYFSNLFYHMRNLGLFFLFIFYYVDIASLFIENRVLKTTVMITFAVFLIPVYKVFKLRSKECWIEFIAKISARLGYSLGLGIIYVFIFEFIFILVDLYSPFEQALYILVVGYWLVSILYPLCKLVFYRLMDKMKFLRLSIRSLDNRNDIYQFYQGLKLESGRLKYVKLLEANIKKVHGGWPNNDFLKMTNMESIILLAQLEEKWRGLDW